MYALMIDGMYLHGGGVLWHDINFSELCLFDTRAEAASYRDEFNPTARIITV